MTLKELQKEILENKKRQGFNTTDMNEEFCHLNAEVGEAYDAWFRDLETFPEELADVAIYLLGMSEILGINLAEEIQKKVYKNEKREYKVINGVNTRVKECDKTR